VPIIVLDQAVDFVKQIAVENLVFASWVHLLEPGEHHFRSLLAHFMLGNEEVGLEIILRDDGVVENGHVDT